ncbi:MAG: PAS domain-containing protein [Deltaproteobacteria bacterium]|nr:PAS domain-containing protein [Deltaproteobacteria bacterium]
MADPMLKTKKELIIMLRDMEMAMQSLQNEPRRLQGELERALSENDRIQDEARRIQQANEKLMLQYDSLKKEHETLELRMQESLQKTDIAYELFKSFVDADSRKTLLIDTTYSICYMNRSAAAHLRLPEPGAIMGRRLFDFFAYKDALKVKKKIDEAFFSGEKEKIKEVAFLNPKGVETQIDLKLARVRYRDKPSIKMTIK